MGPNAFEVVEHPEIPKIEGRGRKHGKGKNLDVLKALPIGGAIIDVPYKKVLSFRYSASSAGIKLKIRKLPGKKTYLIQRLT